MLPNTNIPFEESIASIADVLKRSEMRIDMIRTELVETGKLSDEGDVIIKSIVSKLDQASEMSSIDKFKSWYDSDYIKDTIKERIKDEHEQKLLLGAFDSLRDSLIQSASVTSILTGQIRKSIGSFIGLFTSQLDLPPIVTFMATRVGDVFGSFLQRRKESKERYDALNRKVDDAVVESSKKDDESEDSKDTNTDKSEEKQPDSIDIPTKEQIEGIRESVESSARSLKILESELKKNLGLESSENEELVEALIAKQKEALLGITEGIEQLFDDPQIAGALRELGKSIPNGEIIHETIERALAQFENKNDELIEKLQENDSVLNEQKNVSETEAQEAYQQDTLEALEEIADNTEKAAKEIDKKEKPEGILGKIFSGLMTGMSSLFTGFGKILTAILPNFVTSLAKSIIPSISSLLASPALMASIAAGSYFLFNKYANEHNTELDRAGLAAANPDEIQNSTSTDPSEVMNEKGQEEFKKFTETNKFVEMSIADQFKLGFAKIFGDEETVEKITKKYNTQHFKTEEEQNEFYKKQSAESQDTYSKIDLIPHISSKELENISSSNINILKMDKEQLNVLVDKRLGAGSAVAISPTSVSNNNTNINNSNVVNQSTFMSRSVQLMDPQTTAAMGASFR